MAYRGSQKDKEARQTRKRKIRRARWNPVKVPFQMALPLWSGPINDPRMKTAMVAARRVYRSEWERLRGNAERRTPYGWAVQAWRRIEKRAAELHLPCDILPADLVPTERCPVLGMRFVYGDPTHPYSPSVDKLIPALGYVRGNVTVISRHANQMKSDSLSGSDLRAVADWLDKKLQENSNKY